jgi:hypothetical protein
MDFFSLLWIFFIISSLQPVIRQKMLEAARRRVFEDIERTRNSRVIVLIHRQETMSLLGFPWYAISARYSALWTQTLAAIHLLFAQK